MRNGFTLIELLVVMTVIALLSAIAVPRYIEHIDRAKEAVLRQNLKVLRETIDKFHADRARYPTGLDELVAERYLRSVPVDPITESSATWRLTDTEGSLDGRETYDVHSGAPGAGRDGVPYANW